MHLVCLFKALSIVSKNIHNIFTVLFFLLFVCQLSSGHMITLCYSVTLLLPHIYFHFINTSITLISEKGKIWHQKEEVDISFIFYCTEKTITL